MVSFPVVPRAGARHSISTASCPVTGLRPVSVQGRAGRPTKKVSRGAAAPRWPRTGVPTKAASASCAGGSIFSSYATIEIVDDEAAGQAVGRDVDVEVAERRRMGQEASRQEDAPGDGRTWPPVWRSGECRGREA